MTFVLLLAGAGCSPSHKVKPGAPVLLTFLVLDPTGAPVELVTDAGVANTVPPLAKFYAAFDRLLDPTTLATVVDGGDPMPNTGVALINAGAVSVESRTLYVPNGDPKFTVIPAAFGLPFANGPSLTVTPTLGLPSGSAITVTLDPAKVRSRDQTQPFVAAVDVMPTLMIMTDPLAVNIVVPQPEAPDGGPGDAGGDEAGVDDAGADAGGAGDAGADGGTGADGGAAGVTPPVDSDFVVHIFFNNQTADSTMAAIRVTATVGGAPAAVSDAVVARDPMDPGGWTVSPPPNGWPPGAFVTVTVGADAADNFQNTLGTPVTASFTVKP